MTIKATDTRLDLRIDRALYAQLRAEAAASGISTNELVLRLIAIGRPLRQEGRESPTRSAAREIISRLEREYAE